MAGPPLSLCIISFYTRQQDNKPIRIVPHDFVAIQKMDEPQDCPRCKKKTGITCTTCHFCNECHNAAQQEPGYEMHDKLTESTLKPVTKVKSELDKELQEWEVESSKDGQTSQGT